MFLILRPLTRGRMLYDFHAKQNARQPNSVHATYLLTGRKRVQEHTNGSNGSQKDGEDAVMQSSPYMSSLPEPTEEAATQRVPKMSIVLVRDEELEKTKADFEEIMSIHIYSVEPGPLENLNVLSACNQQASQAQANDDPMERWRLYGSIHNPHVKRRTTKYAPMASTTKNVATKPTAKAAAHAASVKETIAPERRGSASEGNTSGRTTPQPVGNTLKKSDSKSTLRREKSDIFKSFAKAKTKPKDAEVSQESTPAPIEDGKRVSSQHDIRLTMHQLQCLACQRMRVTRRLLRSNLIRRKTKRRRRIARIVRSNCVK
jgi:DNA polymerase delta subunit 3